jgi:DNA-binding CsgD family transcriptional regulator
MSKTDTLRFRHVRDAYRLIGECRDLGGDPVLWQPHMLAGLCRLLDVTQATGGEAWWRRPREPVQPLSAFGFTEDADAHAQWLAYHRAVGPADDPFFHALARVPGRLVTRTRAQLVPDAAWFRSPSFTIYRRPARIVHEMTSILETTDDGGVSVIALNRTAGAPEFSPREQRLFRFFHREIGRLIRRALASATEAGPDTLSPRLRQTLACLVEGDDEKRVATRLGLSQATVHQYVTMLYRRFGVRSRAQLLAHVVKRSSNERWRGFVACMS